LKPLNLLADVLNFRRKPVACHNGISDFTTLEFLELVTARRI
jgi:hypothetical protein